MLHLLLGVLATPISTPARPPDGTYTYAISQGTGPAIVTSSVVVKTNGATFDVTESVKLPNGQTATTSTTWDKATLLPLHYDLRQGTVHLAAPITPTSVKFTGARLSYAQIAGTKFMLVYEGLNAFRMMLPFVAEAHPGESFTVAHINGNTTERGGASNATPPAHGPVGDTTMMLTLGDEQIAVWYNARTAVVDREVGMPGDSRMQLVRYTPR